MLFIRDLTMPDNIKVSIIIRCKNEEKFIDKVLKKIFNQAFDGLFEVIIIDSGSKDKTLDIAKKFPVRIYRMAENQFSFGYALNYSTRLANGKYIVNLSAHAIPADSYWLHNLINPLENGSMVFATYGRQRPIKGLNPIEELELLTIFPVREEQRSLANFSNANCAIIKEVIERYPFDENITWAEDFLWQKSLPPNYTIRYVPEACVYHSHPLLISYWKERFFYNGVAVQYFDRVLGMPYFWKEVDIAPLGLFKKSFKQIIRFSQFFLKNGYYSYVLIFPFFELCRRYFYLKGLRAGEKLYSRREKTNQIYDKHF
jgi:glycosyltransferase involved in cell wall biosynthesis